MSAGDVVVSGVSRAFGDVTVLRGVGLTVAAGTTTAVLGRSGCGKTTLLRIVAGFDRPGAGTVTIGGEVVAAQDRSVPPQRRRIGYVTQEGNLFPHLDVAANVAFGLPRGRRRARDGVAALLEMVGLGSGYGARRPHELSGGEQQRVALARALAPRPDVVLLDEPFSALDAETRAATRRAVAEALAAAGTTTVLVTHDRAEAMSFAGRVALLRDGVVVQEGTPAQLYRSPVDRGVAEFTGDVVALPALLDGCRADTELGPVSLSAPAPSARGTVLVRPEQVRIGDSGTATAVVDDVEFQGHVALVGLAVDDGLRVRARCPGHLVPQPGERVRVSVEGPALVLV
ncbi:MAG: ABC transporter ATP-binding protein [Pseudonocardiaceae bacterium]|nr:MAG: ABC transporter ATP-binding protein [Pseudonocardiaceae bacterium]